MPDEQPANVRIDSVTRTGDDEHGWTIVVEVCNYGSTAVEGLKVSEWPYKDDGKGNHIKIIPDNSGKVTQTVDLPAASGGKPGCKKVPFEVGKTKPSKSYTDIIPPGEYERGISKLFDPVIVEPRKTGSGAATFALTTPYPMRLLRHWGPKSAQFVIDDIRGVPSDWRCDVLYPGFGAPFSIAPMDLESSAFFRVHPLRTIDNPQFFTIRVVQSVINQPRRYPFIYETDVDVFFRLGATATSRAPLRQELSAAHAGSMAIGLPWRPQPVGSVRLPVAQPVLLSDPMTARGIGGSPTGHPTIVVIPPASLVPGGAVASGQPRTPPVGTASPLGGAPPKTNCNC